MGRYFSFKCWKMSLMYIKHFYHICMALICVKYICLNINSHLVQHDARKFQKLSGIFVCLKWFACCKDLRNRGPPISKCEIWWTVIKDKNLKSFLYVRFFIRFHSVLTMKGRIRNLGLWLLCRGEVIPFEIKQSGKRYCTKKILRLLH